MKLSFKIIGVVLLGVVLAVLLTNVVLSNTFNLSIIKELLLIILLAAIPSAILAFLMIQKIILDPIRDLNEVAKVITSGNLGKRVKVKSKDEMGQLEQNFNIVINTLTSSLQGLANSLKNEKIKEKQLRDNLIELDAEKAKDDALLANIGDAVIAIDNQQRIFLFNKAASNMMGFDQAAVISKLYFDILRFFNEKNASPVDDFINKALRGEKFLPNNRLILQKNNGEALPVLYTISPIIDKREQITGVVLVLKDITKERELEKLKDEFVSVASHELRTPMTAIKGLISMIFEGDYGNINEELKDPLSDIAKSTERLIQLVNDMLDVSRIEAGRTKITITEVAVNDVVSEVVNLLKPIANQKNLRLIVSEAVISKIYADIDKVKQILINLITNAIKFTDHGTVTIAYKPQGRYAYISVIDSGIGISKENQIKLFEKFAQISSSQRGRPPGTGLGLYISREFARKMGGELWIESSEVYRGSNFVLALPFVNSIV